MSLMSAKKLLLPSAGGPLDIDKLFRTTLFVGPGGASKRIVNGLDFLGRGGLSWSKYRDGGAQGHKLVDTGMPLQQHLETQSSATLQANGASAFHSDGVTYGANLHDGSSNYVSWDFLKSKKFFDIVTYAGDGSTSRTIPHSLGIKPGFIVVKSYSGGVSGWSANAFVGSDVYNMRLDQTEAASIARPRISSCNAATFTIDGANGNAEVNASGRMYVAYVFAHDPSPRGIIKCGVYDGNRSSSARLIGLGWEPQFSIIKPVTGSFGAGNWFIHDSKRMTDGYADRVLFANASEQEGGTGQELRYTTAGMELRFQGAGLNNESTRYFYMAIRKGRA